VAIRGFRLAALLGLGVALLILPLPAQRAAALQAPPSGTVYPGQVLKFSVDLGELDVKSDTRHNCGNPPPYGGPVVYNWTVTVPGQYVNPSRGQGGSFGFSVVVAQSRGFVFPVDVSVYGTCGISAAYSASGRLGLYSIRPGPPPSPQNQGPLATLTAWVQNIIEQMRTKYDPCDPGAIADGTQSAACGEQGFRRNPQFWKATGSLVCTTEVAKSYSGPFTPITTGAAARDCIEKFPPPKRLKVNGAAGHSTSARASARVKAGSYRGMSIGLASSGKPPTKKLLRRRGAAVATFLRSHKRPRNARPISLEVGKRGRTLTFSPNVSLTCEDGSSVVIKLTDLPDPAAPVLASRQGYFKLAAEDPLVTARIGGRFVNGRSLAGAFYLGVRMQTAGLCESLVAFAAHRKG
jgi:hypothetical protein